MRILNGVIATVLVLLTVAMIPRPGAGELAPDPKTHRGELRFVVDLGERMVYVFRGSMIVRTHDVAVGQPRYPTPTGSWAFYQVDINPDWTPPDSDWSEDAEYTPPGHPDNPMGRARLIFNRPYTIHGTDRLDSLGRAVSHGSIRVANRVAIELAELLLKDGGAWPGRAQFQRMLATPTEMYEIRLENRVPIHVVE